MSEVVLDANQLAQGRTEMAFQRSTMALDRTLMAWIRTSLSLIGFGFTIYKFLQTLGERTGSPVRENAPRNLGLFMIGLGMGLLLLAILQYRAAIKKAMALEQGFDKSARAISLSMIGAIGVLLVGLFTLLNMFTGVGGF